MKRTFELVECIYHPGELIIVATGDYHFCDNALVTVEKGLDSSTVPSEEFRKVAEILGEEKENSPDK